MSSLVVGAYGAGAPPDDAYDDGGDDDGGESLTTCERAFARGDYATCAALSAALYRRTTVALDSTSSGDADVGPSPRVSTATQRALAADDDGRDDKDDARTSSKFMRDLYENIEHPRIRAALRRMYRTYEYAHEMPRECVCDADAADVAKAWARAAVGRERDRVARATSLWIQSTFKTTGLTTYDADRRALLGESSESTMTTSSTTTTSEWGPAERVLWCKLKWEQRDGDHDDIERVIRDTFEYVTKHDVLENLARRDDDDDDDQDDDDSIANVVERERALEAWTDALGKMAWLYASQIVATARDDKEAATRWLHGYRDILDEEIVTVTQSWIDDANTTPEMYRFEATRDATTGDVSVRNQIVRDEDEDAEEYKDSRETPRVGATTTPVNHDDDDGVADDVNHDDDGVADDDVFAALRSVLASCAPAAREILANPTGDVALRVYASSAIASFVIYSVVCYVKRRFFASDVRRRNPSS